MAQRAGYLTLTLWAGEARFAQLIDATPSAGANSRNT
jgi:hypothetical protein